MTALDRLANVPPVILVGFAMAIIVVLAMRVAQWLGQVRMRRGERIRLRQEMGYNWSWREFWFAPRQRKLPPPRRD